MTWKKIYKGMHDSTPTFLITGISATDTTVTVGDINTVYTGETEGYIVFGAIAPTETAKYTESPVGNTFNNVVRGVSGTAQSWSADTIVTRRYSNADQQDIIDTTKELQDAVDELKEAPLEAPQMTTEERDLLVPVVGMIIYNTSVGELEQYAGTAWSAIGSGSGGDGGVSSNADTLDGYHAASFALATKGVTNGDTHDHSGGDGGQIAYNSLAGTPSVMAPSAHAINHKTGGNDVLTATDVGAAATNHTHTGVYLPTSGTAADASKLGGALPGAYVLGSTLGTASTKNVPVSGDASASDVVLGNDTRLSDPRTPTTHNHDGSYLAIGGKASDSDKLDGNDSTAFSLTSHNHNAAYLGIGAKAVDSDLLDGHEATYFEPSVVTLPISKGGTGTSSAPSDGNVLIGKTDGTYALTTITAGANITVSNGNGTITIAGAAAGEGVNTDADTLDSHHASEFSLTTHNHNASYLGISAKAADSELLDAHDSTYFATSTHNHDGTYLKVIDVSTDADTLDTHHASEFVLTSAVGTAAAKNIAATGNAITTEVVMGNDTRLTDARAPTTHNHDTSYLGIHGTSDDALKLGGVLPAGYAVSSHTHDYLTTNGKAADSDKLDGIDSTGFVQTNDASVTNARAPTAHAASHATGQGDAITPSAIGASASDHTHTDVYLPVAGVAADSSKLNNVTASGYVLTGDSRLSDTRTPSTHATSHKSGGGDAIKLDELAAPTDITTLNVSSTAHGLCPKLPNNTTTYLRGDGTFATLSGGSGTTIARTEYLTSLSLTDYNAGTTGSVDIETNLGSIARLRMYTEYKGGQMASWVGANTNAIDNTTTSLAFTTTSGTLPAVGSYLWLEHECVRISAGTVTPLTIVRGQKGTVAAPHDAGVMIIVVNDGMEIQLYPNATFNPEECLGRISFMPWFGTVATTIVSGSSVKQIVLNENPTLISDFGQGDWVKLDNGTTNEYAYVQDVYGVGTLAAGMQKSIFVQKAGNWTNAYTGGSTSTGHKVYRVMNYDLSIPFKFDSGNLLYYKIQMNDGTTGMAAVTVYMNILVDKFA